MGMIQPQVTLWIVSLQGYVTSVSTHFCIQRAAGSNQVTIWSWNTVMRMTNTRINVRAM